MTEAERSRDPWRTTGDLPRQLLLVSGSARLLAQSAARAGIRAVALDHYADTDTRAATADVMAIPEPGGDFDPLPLLDAAARLAPPGAYPLVYGSGLDSNPALLDVLAQGREVIGNSPAIQRLFRVPGRFFRLLGACGIPYPEIRSAHPPDPANWVIKSGCSEGGKRVRFCAHVQAGSDEYYQRRLSGPALSALFLADGRGATILGFNTLWTAERPGQPFLFIGAINQTQLDDSQRQQIQSTVARLVEASGLVGLNSLDFMLDAVGGLQVIEVNARPSATMALYDDDYPEGLLAAHIRACRGRLPAGIPAARVRAFRVLLAPETMTVHPGMEWPHWCADVPARGTVIEPGRPLCTLRAEGDSRASVQFLIEQRITQLHRLIASVRSSVTR